ncbi:MAG: hypothetical protein ACFB2Z_09145 [Maricaulaceae bacterium]
MPVLMQVRLADLEDSVRDIAAQEDALFQLTRLPGLSVADQVETDLKRLKAIAKRFPRDIHRLIKARVKRGETLRYLLWSHDVQRPARDPDPLDTALRMAIFVGVEGGAVAAMMVAGGKLAIVEAAAYGLSFAAVTAAAGISAGFFGLRYALYKRRSPSPAPEDAKVRRFGLAWFAGLAGLQGLLLFASARVRATGDHGDIFNFESAGFFTTFNDALSLCILTVGVIGAALSIWEGFGQISDPVPGLTEARRHAEAEINGEVADLTEDAQERIAACEDTLTDIEDAIEELAEQNFARDEARASYNDKVRAHNNAVQKAKRAVRDRWAEQAEARTRITRKPGRKPGAPDLKIFDALMLEPLGEEQAAPASAEYAGALSRQAAILREAMLIAETAVDDALAEYAASAPDLDMLPDTDPLDNGAL